MELTRIGDSCYRGTRSRRVECVRLMQPDYEVMTVVDR